MKERSSIFAVVYLLAVSYVLPQTTSRLAHIANGTFPTGRVTTTFVLFNNTNALVGTTLDLRDDDGAALQVTISGVGTDSSFSLALQPGETLFLQTDGMGDLVQGSATLSSTAEIGFSATFTIRDLQGNFITESGVGRSSGFIEAALPVDATATFLTGVGIQNLTGTGMTVTFTLYDGAGQQQGASVNRQIAGHGHLGVFATGAGGLFPAIGSLRGRLVIFSNSQFAAVTLRQNSDPLSFTTLPVVSTSSTQTHFLLPQIADGGGILTTTFIVFSLTDQPANVELLLSSDDGSPFEVTYLQGSANFAVPAHGAVFVQTDGSRATPDSGTARVNSDQPVGVSAIYTLSQNGNFLTETGVGDSAQLVVATLPVDTTGTFDTGLAILNPGDAATGIQLRFDNGVGAAPAGAALETMISLGPGEHFAKLIKGDIFPEIGEQTGSLTIRADSSIAPVVIRQNSAPLSFTTLPAAAGAVTPPGGSGGSGEGTSEGTTSGPSGCGTSNQPAVATVWATYTVSEGFEGQIQATNALDPEDTGVFFEWKVTDGHGRMTTADLQDRLTSTVRFTAPQAPITIDLELFVKDALSCGTRYPIELVVVRNVTGDAPLDVFLGIPDLSEDTILDVQIPGGFWISGTVGTPVAAQTADFNLSSVGLAYAISPAGERYWGGLFDGSQPNQYRIAVPAGSYQTVLCFNGSADGTFLQIGWKSGDFLEVSADVSRNATLKIGTIYEVSGVVTGLDAIPDPHPGAPHPVSLFFFSGEQGPGSEGGTLHIVGTGLVSPTGTFSVHLLEGVYQVQAVIFRDESPDFAQFTFLNLGLLNVTGPTIGVQIPLPPLVTVGGKVEKDIKSSGIAGELDPFTITAHGLPFPDTFPWFQERCLLPHDYSDDEVFHQVFSETYDDLLLQSEIPYNISAGFLDDETGGFLNVPWENVHSFSIESEEPVAANFTLDFEVPEDLPEAYELTGKVTGPDFEPFQGALVLVGTINLHNHINVQFGHSDETDENGRYSMMLRAGRNYAVGVIVPRVAITPGSVEDPADDTQPVPR